ncbi:hypothetical protein [Staphylococcus auricularis]|uniref:hypothetical protein n=1 Tax=Staphylococcus auricularis TaxID=29379 RepID=UPI00242AA8BA|nr:hypothetical protein [Staphylococcus auricularis]
MNFVEILGTLFGIVVLPLSAVGFLMYEFTKTADSRSLVLPVVCILGFIICGFGLVIVANILEP